MNWFTAKNKFLNIMIRGRKHCNMAKRAMNFKDFKKWVRRIYGYLFYRR